MKKLYLLVLVCSFSFFSCETETEGVENSVADLTLKSMDGFTYSNIGLEENGEFKLAVTKTSILNSAKKFSDKFGLGIEPESVKITTIENKKYLRIYSKDNLVSTVELILDSSNNYQTGGTVCTSEICASGGGCIPDGVYCTECKYGENGQLPGDCKRTTTSGPVTEL